MNQGQLLLFPVPLSGGLISSLSVDSVQAMQQTTFYVVENAKTARHWIKAIAHPVKLQDIQVLQIDRNKPTGHWPEIRQNLFSGRSVGLMSEAGLPTVADPGYELVSAAHKDGIVVKPFAGPNSMMMALMSSGLPAQQFCFDAYLPSKKDALRPAVIRLVQEIKKNAVTRIFMETAYRNNQLFETLLAHVPDSFLLCIAAGISSGEEFILTKTIKEWKEMTDHRWIELPAIYVLQQAQH